MAGSMGHQRLPRHRRGPAPAAPADAATMAALDHAVAAAGVRDDIWHPGLSATTLVPRATALAHHFGHWADAHT